MEEKIKLICENENEGCKENLSKEEIQSKMSEILRKYKVEKISIYYTKELAHNKCTSPKN